MVTKVVTGNGGAKWELEVRGFISVNVESFNLALY